MQPMKHGGTFFRTSLVMTSSFFWSSSNSSSLCFQSLALHVDCTFQTKKLSLASKHWRTEIKIYTNKSLCQWSSIHQLRDHFRGLTRSTPLNSTSSLPNGVHDLSLKRQSSRAKQRRGCLCPPHLVDWPGATSPPFAAPCLNHVAVQSDTSLVADVAKVVGVQRTGRGPRPCHLGPARPSEGSHTGSRGSSSDSKADLRARFSASDAHML